MTVGPPLAFDFPLPISPPTTTLSSSSSSSSTSSSSSSSTATSTPSTVLPLTNHYGGDAPLSSTQTCSTACAIAIPVVLLSLLTIGLLFAYFKHRHHGPPTPPVKSAIAAGSAPASTPTRADPLPAGDVPSRGTCAQRMRSFFNSKNGGPERVGAAGEGGRGANFSTRRQSAGHDPWAEGYVDLEAGQELGREMGHGRSGSEVSELTLTEALAERGSGERKLEA
ncbi:hypothetical protein MMC15_002936 [Xylographa vitiligo]|nr:hypothetical protein [Xylographa vitiligo]